MSNCYVHPEKTATRSCYECGKPICHHCVFQEVISSRVTRYTSVDREIEINYGFYCPTCFIPYAEKKGYDKGPVGALIRVKGSPNKTIFGILWIFFLLGFVFNFLLFGTGFIFWGGMVLCIIGLKYQAIKNFKKYDRALELTGR